MVAYDDGGHTGRAGALAIRRELGFTGASGHTSFSIGNSNSLSSELLSNLPLVISHSYIREAAPPPGAVRDDQRLGVVLRVSL